jgi:hypothetical protein
MAQDTAQTALKAVAAFAPPAGASTRASQTYAREIHCHCGSNSPGRLAAVRPGCFQTGQLLLQLFDTAEQIQHHSNPSPVDAQIEIYFAYEAKIFVETDWEGKV